MISRRLKVPMKHVQSWFKHQRISEAAISKASCNKGDSTPTNGSTLHGATQDNETEELSEEQLAKPDTAACKSNFDSSCLPCALCPSEFVSNRLLSRHTALHSTGCTFPCASCPAVFLHQMVRDTHTLTHCLNAGSCSSAGTTNASSELGLKARSKVLDRETKTRLRNLISRDVEEVLSGGTVEHCVADEGKTLRGMLTGGVGPGSSSSYHGDENVLLDCDADDDDDAKLVIDE